MRQEFLEKITSTLKIINDSISEIICDEIPVTDDQSKIILKLSILQNDRTILESSLNGILKAEIIGKDYPQDPMLDFIFINYSEKKLIDINDFSKEALKDLEEDTVAGKSDTRSRLTLYAKRYIDEIMKKTPECIRSGEEEIIFEASSVLTYFNRVLEMIDYITNGTLPESNIC